VKRAALTVSTRCIVACDSSKFGQTAFARVAGLDQIDLIISDNELTSEQRRGLQVDGTLLRLA
jgi:DeoR/GlpR family transcriptional regulator of sugar metabolism